MEYLSYAVNSDRIYLNSLETKHLIFGSKKHLKLIKMMVVPIII